MLRACSHVATAPISIRPLSRGCYSTLGRWRFLGLATFATLVWLYRCSRNVCLAGIRAHGRCLSSRLRRGTVDSSPCVVARNRPVLALPLLGVCLPPRAFIHTCLLGVRQVFIGFSLRVSVARLFSSARLDFTSWCILSSLSAGMSFGGAEA